MPRKPIPEELLTEKQKKGREHRKKYKKYYKKYDKFYYLKNSLAGEEYNKKRWEREKELKQLNKKNKTNNISQSE